MVSNAEAKAALAQQKLLQVAVNMLEAQGQANRVRAANLYQQAPNEDNVDEATRMVAEANSLVTQASSLETQAADKAEELNKLTKYGRVISGSPADAVAKKQHTLDQQQVRVSRRGVLGVCRVPLLVCALNCVSSR